MLQDNALWSASIAGARFAIRLDSREQAFPEAGRDVHREREPIDPAGALGPLTEGPTQGGDVQATRQRSLWDVANSSG